MNEPLLFILVFALIIGWFPFAVFTSYVANQKGYSLIAWLIIGLIFPIPLIPFIIVASLPDRKLRKYIRLIAERQPNSLIEDLTL
tara:strand:+ start:7769 stop:8023 length:255 start_codon:yes stop_codon:yes gene_type:complete